MELIKLLGVLIVIVGFALKLDSILIIFLALIATGIVGGLGVGGLLETIGTNCSEQKYGNLYHDPAGYRYTGKKRSA